MSVAATAVPTSSSNLLTVPSPVADATNPTRPSFNSQRTQDRLREGEGLYAMIFRTDSNLQRGRKSVFKETGLEDDTASEMTDVSFQSTVTSPSSQELSPFPSHEGPVQGRPLESWYVWAVLLACFVPR
ncbi:kelch repeat [Trichoderma arundinaceum]|uniref:Kelch repeat n=1 Tax=Trichoderma arundinaceum TaxID=490622 RepID=A0A395NI45_TRIAR|nr:kelch repeat [Trichoderma arundinaceum]